MTCETSVDGADHWCAEQRLKVLLAERDGLRREIAQHKSTQQMVLNFIIILIAAELAAFSQISRAATNYNIEYVLLLVPMPFALLAFYHSAYTVRIHYLAIFLYGDVGSKIESIVGGRVLPAYSYHPTRYVGDVRYSKFDGKMVYLSLMGLKGFPQAAPIALYLSLFTPSSIWLWALLILDLFIMAASTLWQHD